MTITRKFYNTLKWLLFIVAVFFVAFGFMVTTYMYFDRKYQDKYFPGTQIASIDVAGLTKAEAEKKIHEKIDKIQNEGVVFAYHNEKAKMDTVLTSTGADIALPVILFDTDLALEKAYDYPRSDSWLFNIGKRMELWNTVKNFDINLVLKKEGILTFLNDNFAHFSTPAKDASLIATTSPYKQEIEFGVSNEIYGQSLDYGKALKDLHTHLSKLDLQEILLEASVEYPALEAKECVGIQAKAQNVVDQAPIVIDYEADSWEINRNKLLELMQIKKVNDEVIVGLDQDKVLAFFEEDIIEKVNREAVDAKFEIVDGRVEQFQVNRDGLELVFSSSFRNLEDRVLAKSTSTAILVTKITESKSSTEEMENLGITELLGTGYSSFAGSPWNRRHNISVGAASVNGSLIPPGEEFSLLDTLGEINGETGYKQELVIKENKTIPEYGGGLCQIGTTVFRGTVESGLPVTMRRNHSYRVGYYEPAGTDATIYDPWPDYKFKNDTSHHVLIQSRIEGDDLYFDFWGTNDGRVASHTEPTIYNIKKPGPTKMIETLDLAPGEKKCTESAHNGADAYFDYGVKYPDGEQVNTHFKSHYVPWQAVCLIGVEKLSTSTEEILE